MLEIFLRETFLTDVNFGAHNLIHVAMIELWPEFPSTEGQGLQPYCNPISRILGVPGVKGPSPRFRYATTGGCINTLATNGSSDGTQYGMPSGDVAIFNWPSENSLG